MKIMMLTLRLGDPPLLIRNGAVEQHAHSLEDELLVDTLDSKDSLVPVEVCAVLLNQTSNPTTQHHLVDVPLVATGHRRNRRVMLMLGIRVKKLGVKVEHALELEGIDVEEFLGADLG